MCFIVLVFRFMANSRSYVTDVKKLKMADKKEAIGRKKDRESKKKIGGGR